MRAGLVLIDLQRDFLARSGLTPSADTLVANVTRLLAAFRASTLPVVHVRTLVNEDIDNRMPHWKRQNFWGCVDGTPGACAPAELEAIPGEPVLAKSFFSSFQNSELDAFLRPRVELLVVTGLYTHACVHTTILDAYQRGYEVWVASDGVASYDPLYAALTQDYLEARACRFMALAEIGRRLNLRGNKATVAQPPGESVHAGVRWQASSDTPTLTLHNPAQWSERLYTVEIGNEADVNHAFRLSSARQPKWAGEAIRFGVERLRAWADALRSRRTAIVLSLVREIGKPVRDAEAEFDYALGLLYAAVDRRRPDQSETLAEGVQVRHYPLGVVGLITPWNNPLAIPVGKIAPALANGNTVLWKPALPARSVTAQVLETLAEAGFPEDCVNVVLGDAGTGQAVVVHPDIAAISFTGSLAVGRAIGALCAVRGKILQAELGGNNGVVIGECHDLRQAAADLALMAFSFAGQRCTAPRRIIIPCPQYDGFLTHFLEQVGKLRLGAPTDPDTQVGPMVSRERRDDIMARIEGSLDQGGRILCGGRIPRRWRHGCWFEPTVIVPGDHQDAIVHEESFGPVVVIQRADDFKAAVTLCNGVQQGLVASLYSDDADQQRYFSNQAQAGILRINDDRRGIHPEAPFGGWKASGMGPPEHGRWDEAFYSRPQAVYWRQHSTPFHPPQPGCTAWKH